MKKLIQVRKHYRKGKVVKAHMRNCDKKKVRKYLKNYDSERDGEQTAQDKEESKLKGRYDEERAKVQGVDMMSVKRHMRRKR